MVDLSAGQVDRSRVFVLDPVVLVYAGYIGGSSWDEGFGGIAVDGSGNAYITGRTNSTEASFPVTVGPDLTNNGLPDAFVVKVNPSGTALVYAGYIGGSNGETGLGIAADVGGSAYVTGSTSSSNFPVVNVGPDLSNGPSLGAIIGFVAKVNPAGTALVYAGYLGAGGQAIAVDGSGNAYVTGAAGGMLVKVGPDLTFNGGSPFQPQDAFVAKVNAAGTALVYAGYIGGSGDDVGFGIAVDGSGNAYVAGITSSTEASFPVTVGPDLTNNGVPDAFVAKVNAAGTALVYAGYIGGSGFDQGRGIAVDASGNAYVTGLTYSTQGSFSVTVGPDLTNNGVPDAFVAKVNAAGTALAYAGYIGGSGGDDGRGIAVDGSGNAYVTGNTTSTEATFPVTGGPDLTHNDPFGPDAFVAKVNAAGTALVYAGYIGGSGSDDGYGIAVDAAGNAFVTGITHSTEATFPATVGPDLTGGGFNADAFVAKIGSECVSTPVLSVSVSPHNLWPAKHQLVPVTATVQVSDACDPSPSVVLLSAISNEPDNGLGDGDTANDVQNAAVGTYDVAINLRAERSGTGTGRTYTITYKATNAAGNMTTASATVTVPRDQR